MAPLVALLVALFMAPLVALLMSLLVALLVPLLVALPTPLLVSLLVPLLVPLLPASCPCLSYIKRETHRERCVGKTRNVQERVKIDNGKAKIGPE